MDRIEGTYRGLIAGRLWCMLPGALGAAALYAILLPRRLRRLSRRGERTDPARERALLALWAYCGGMAVLLLTPPRFRWGLLPGYLRDPGTFFSPGIMILEPLRTWIDLDLTYPWSVLCQVGNVALFMPFGAVPPLLWRRYGWRRALLSGACLTLGIESCQLLVGRTFDVDDLCMNTAGVLLGWAAWRIADAASHGRARLWCAERGRGDGGDP